MLHRQHTDYDSGHIPIILPGHQGIAQPTRADSLSEVCPKRGAPPP